MSTFLHYGNGIPTSDSTQCCEKMGQEEWEGPIEDSDHAAPRTHSRLNVAIELAPLTPNLVHERPRQHIQIATGRPMIVHIPATTPIIPPTPRSESPPPLPVSEPPPLSLLLLVGGVDVGADVIVSNEATGSVEATVGDKFGARVVV
jgi:hypothetical protein